MKINYIYINGVQIVEYETSSYDDFIRTIIRNTANTWQKGRDEEEKGSNTIQGKDAEIAVIKYFDEYVDFTYLPYDCIRMDAGKLHAPFDGLLYKNKQVEKEILEKTVKHIQDETLNNNGQITKETREMLRERKIFTVEVKSTKVNKTKKENAISDDEDVIHETLIQNIRRDDFFIYPHFCRDSKIITSFNDYVKYIEKNGLLEASNRTNLIYKIQWTEYYNASDIQIRVYMDIQSQRCYIMGYILVKDIIKNKKIKKMKQENKSEDAVYLTIPLTKGKSLNMLFSDDNLWNK